MSIFTAPCKKVCVLKTDMNVELKKDELLHIQGSFNEDLIVLAGAPPESFQMGG